MSKQIAKSTSDNNIWGNKPNSILLKIPEINSNRNNNDKEVDSSFVPLNKGIIKTDNNDNHFNEFVPKSFSKYKNFSSSTPFRSSSSYNDDEYNAYDDEYNHEYDN